MGQFLAAADDPRGAAIEAGRRFGERLLDAEQSAGVAAPTVERVLALLDDIGFRPELAPDGKAILLHHCPFHELARDRPEVVCNIHLGLLRGALRQLGAPAEAIRLIPFVAPELCVVELAAPPARAD